MLIRPVVEVGREGAVSGQLPIERMIVDFELVCDELDSRGFVSGDDAGHASVGLERP